MLHNVGKLCVLNTIYMSTFVSTLIMTLPNTPLARRVKTFRERVEFTRFCELCAGVPHGKSKGTERHLIFVVRIRWNPDAPKAKPEQRVLHEDKRDALTRLLSCRISAMCRLDTYRLCSTQQKAAMIWCAITGAIDPLYTNQNVRFRKLPLVGGVFVIVWWKTIVLFIKFFCL